MNAAQSNPRYRHSDENPSAAKVDRSIPFIETHHHLWELERFHYNWLRDPGTAAHNQRLGDYKMIRRDWGIERLLKEFYGSKELQFAHVASHSRPAGPRRENAWFEALPRRH